MKESDLSRFLDKILFHDDECWIWTGGLSDGGYAHFKLNGKTQYAHRVAYEWFVRSIPTGAQLDHLCRVRFCVNPDHLEPVDYYENRRRSPIVSENKTHCNHGHEFTPENTHIYVGKDGRSERVCRTCRYLAVRRSRGYLV